MVLVSLLSTGHKASSQFLKFIGNLAIPTTKIVKIEKAPELLKASRRSEEQELIL